MTSLRIGASHETLRIVIAASEAVPWSKTGGLADVSTALAKSMSAAGHEVSLMVPYHRQTPFAKAHKDDIHDTGVVIDIPVGPTNVRGKLYWTNLPNSNVRVVLIDQLDFFDRSSLYQDVRGDYSDNCERFVFFSRAVIEASRKLVLRPHIIHANDWQTGLVPALLEAEHRGEPGFENTKCVFTIHNLAYQGWFWHLDMPLTGLDWKYFNPEQMECHEQLNLLKTGIAFADHITTVSPTYAAEIQTPEFGCGLDGYLQQRATNLTGILNGIDLDTWNPAIDRNLVTNYDWESVAAKKPVCKKHLQNRLGLPQRADVPLFGMISRMADQKGFDLITQQASSLLEQDIQIAILGSGDEKYESMISEMAKRAPERVSASIGFDEELAHQIEAGSDFYLMPSRFEPCGLNQMYSLAYGTVPLVRAVGGLADSVTDVNVKTLSNGTATGIVFQDYKGQAFFEAVIRCLELYRNPEAHQKVVRAGNLYSHGLCAITLSEAYAMTKDPDLLRPAQAALNYIAFAQDPVGGGWRYAPKQPGDTSVVGWQLMALKSGKMAYLNVDDRVLLGASRFLDSVQDDGGASYGYASPGSRGATTSIGLLCRMYMGWDREHRALERGVRRLSKSGPSNKDMYYNYYATQVMRHYEGEMWEKWNKQMRDFLVNTQEQNGHMQGSWHMGSSHAAKAGGRLYNTALSTMVLEVYYRHLPIYRTQAVEEDFKL
ncbi:glycogen synthase GlgA [Planctomycetota bacterium]